MENDEHGGGFSRLDGGTDGGGRAGGRLGEGAARGRPEGQPDRPGGHPPGPTRGTGRRGERRRRAQAAAHRRLRGDPAGRADARHGRLRDGQPHQAPRTYPARTDHLPHRRGPRRPARASRVRGVSGGLPDQAVRPVGTAVEGVGVRGAVDEAPATGGAGRGGPATAPPDHRGGRGDRLAAQRYRRGHQARPGTAGAGPPLTHCRRADLNRAGQPPVCGASIHHHLGEESMKAGKVLIAAALLAAAGATAFAVARPESATFNPKKVADESVTSAVTTADKKTAPDHVQFHLVPSSDKLKQCMPHAKVNITVKLRTDATGRDVFLADASGLPPKTSFTVFLLEVPGAPFGAAEYIGDVNTDRYGKAHAEFELIVQEAFASTLVDGKRVRVDLNHVGMWFADPTADDFCLGKNSPVTPFDGDGEAGVQAFNSSNSLPGAPLPAP